MVDKLSKVAHFIPVKTTYLASEVAQVFIREIARLHGVPKNIVSDRDAKFISKFLKDLFAGLGTKLAFNTTYHPQTDGQTKRVNMILEYMLRMYVMHQQRKWKEYLPLVEFTYNNSYQESLRMSRFEVLYGQSCYTPISWSDPVNKVLIGPDMLVDMEQEIQVIKKNLKPFDIIERIVPVAYRLALPPIVKVHDVFHISLLKKYIKDVDHVIDWSVLEVEQEGEFQREPQCILQRKHLMLRNRAIEQVKVQWKHFGSEEATWEMANQMRALYTSLFTS
eukprot:PITA_24735